MEKNPLQDKICKRAGDEVTCNCKVKDYFLDPMHISETLPTFPPSTMYPWPLVSSFSPGVSPTSFKDWEKIDREEQRVGQERGKPREKVLSVERMMEIVQEGR